MKSKSLLIMLLMAMFAPWAANAQVYKYVPVTSLDQITTATGDAYVIACPTENWQYGATATISSGSLNATAEQVSFNGSDISDIKTAAEWTLEKVNGTNNQYRLKNGSNYLGSQYKNSSYNLRTTTTPYEDDYWKWTIAINEGVLTITNVNYSNYKLYFYGYNTQKRFQLNNSTSTYYRNIGLYKKTEDTNPSVTVSPESVKIVEDGTAILTAIVNNAPGATVTWSTSHGDVAEISSTTGATTTVTGITEGSATITATITVNEIDYTATCAVTVSNDILMQNGSITTCKGTFYDDGGNSDYLSGTHNMTFTINPGTSGKMVQANFTSFAVENYYSDPDYLEIYDGTSAAATLIKKYTKADNNTTFTVTATNENGALTFHFVTDGSGVAAGWAATIACVDPAEFEFAEASDVEYNTATVNWTGGKAPFTVEYKKHTDASYTTASTTVNIRLYNLTSLEPETAYDVQVTDANNNVISEENYFTTPAIPIALSTATDVTASSAIVNWTGGKANYKVEYKPNGTSAWILAEENISGTSYNLTGLTSRTSYDVRVTDAYDNFLEEENYFITECSAYALPYTYGFETATDMDCWSTINATSSTGIYSTTGHGSSSKVFKFHYSTTQVQYLITPELSGTSPNGVKVTFYYKCPYTSQQESFKVGYSTTDNAISSFDGNWDDEITYKSSAWAEYSHVFPTGTKYIAINYTAIDKYELYIDDISFTVPENTFTIEGNWNVANNWLYGTLPTDADDVVINAACTIPANCIAEANSITFGTNGSLTIADGGQLFTNNAVQATVQKHIIGRNNGGGWNFVASPIFYEANPSTVGMLTGDYDLYRFNPLVEPDDQGKIYEWENYKVHSTDDFSLYNGHGYLYANLNDVNLVFAGTVNDPNAISSYDYNSEALSNFRDWHLVGNPYMYAAYPNTSYYVVSGSTIAEPETSGAVAPCEGIMIQGTSGSVNFTRIPENKAQPSNLKVTLAQQVAFRGTVSSAKLDKAILSFNEGSQLSKFYFGENKANIYIPQGNEKYAIVYSEGMGEMPLNFRANENGNYTLSFSSENTEFSYLHLIDNMTGNDVDLLQTPSYSFNATSTDYESRFKLVFATGAADGSETFAFFSNGSFVINNEGNATLQVIDITGRILSSKTINDCANVNVNAAPGVYMLRLVNGANVKVQKVVVK